MQLDSGQENFFIMEINQDKGKFSFVPNICLYLILKTGKVSTNTQQITLPAQGDVRAKMIWKCSVTGDNEKNLTSREMDKTKHSLIYRDLDFITRLKIGLILTG